ncbi:MAG: arsenosugar biosynthesis radical SAM protein ArsS [Gammaproteobacteria bacterium]|nr:arsenosugar biosynthesis radical SAM protein ArsS [Gammaproteobacteria bacterium]MBQ0838999.1 arsenosugar biosynthesis radical SAM protein ArsS [Gammaproteobacteria bacterium]
MLDTRPLLLTTDFPAMQREVPQTLQVNLGYLCNLSCTHCHVNAGPKRRELMDREQVDLVLEVLQQRQLKTLDLTGGAPEMNPHFRYLVERARELGVTVIDRCNLTILQEPGYEDLAAFLASQGVDIVASLPCYSAQNVAEQRGKGIFETSITALKNLNELGYGQGKGLQLNLVYNPNGTFLPPPQAALEQEYKTHLQQEFGLQFDQLFTITNMPIKRYGAMLLAKGEYEAYMQLLKDNFSADNLRTVMCRQLLSVDWQGYLYDCDFNQMLELAINSGNKASSSQSSLIGSDRARPHLRDLLTRDFSAQPIVVGEHCYACTAGQGSSCGGSLHEE